MSMNPTRSVAYLSGCGATVQELVYTLHTHPDLFRQRLTGYINHCSRGAVHHAAASLFLHILGSRSLTSEIQGRPHEINKGIDPCPSWIYSAFSTLEQPSVFVPRYTTRRETHKQFYITL
jgi:hypothetical protein